MTATVVLTWQHHYVDDAGVEHVRTMRRTVPACAVCGDALTVGQPGRHWSCSPTCPNCHRPVGPDGCCGGAP